MARISIAPVACLFLSAIPGALPQGQVIPERRLESTSTSLGVTVREKTLGFRSSDMLENSFRLSPDGESLAYAITAGGSISVHLNNVAGEPFEGMYAPTLKFSPDGRRLVYVAFRDNKQYVVLDGKKYEYPAIGDQGVHFSPDSAHAGWVAQSPSGKQIAVVDGVAGEEYDGIAGDGVTFSHDSQHSVYLATNEGREALVLDGQPGPFLEDILEYWWSPVGSRLGYIARDGDAFLVFVDGELVAEGSAVGKNGIRFARGADKYFVAVQRNGRWTLLIDGEEHGDYFMLLPNFSISRDGGHYALLAFQEEGDPVSLIVDGEPASSKAETKTITFNPATTAIAFTAKEEGKMYAIVDGEKGPLFDAIDKPGVFFSADGEHYAYSCWLDGKRRVVLDGKLGPIMDRFGQVQPTFFPNGLLVYTARVADTTRVVANNKMQISYDQIGPISRSINGDRYGYVAEHRARRIVVIDGEEAGFHEHVVGPPVFSDDGQRYAYLAARDRKFFVVLDGVELEEFDYIMPGSLAFTPDSQHLIYMSARGTGRYIMVDDIRIENEYTGFSQVRDVHFADAKNFSVRGSQGDRFVLIAGQID